MSKNKALTERAEKITTHRVRMPYGPAIEAMQTIVDLANDTITDPAYAIAASMSLDALKREAAQEINAPLTLEELRGMDGEPVWVEFRGTPKWNEWRIVNWDCQMGAIRLWDNTGMWWRFNPSYVTAYRRKPEGGGE